MSIVSSDLFVQKNCKTHFKLSIIAHVNRLILVICASLTATMAAVSPSGAETLSFSEHNFSIELPANWSRADANAPGGRGSEKR